MKNPVPEPKTLEQLHTETYQACEGIVKANEELIALLLKTRQHEQDAIQKAQKELRRIAHLIRKAHRETNRAKLHLAEYRPPR